jgi:hypothetical protein
MRRALFHQPFHKCHTNQTYQVVKQTADHQRCAEPDNFFVCDIGLQCSLSGIVILNRKDVKEFGKNVTG